MADHADLDRAHAALLALSDEEVDAAVHAIADSEHLATLAQALNLKRPALGAHPHPSELIRGRLDHGAPARIAYTALALAGPCADRCIDRLGDTSDDPSRDDMLGVLPELIDDYGPKMVTLMLTAYPPIDAPCGAVFNELLDSDERFAIAPEAWAALHEQHGHGSDDADATDVVVDEAAVDRARRERDARIAADAKRRFKRRRK
jgi:hypothetical protein